MPSPPERPPNPTPREADLTDVKRIVQFILRAKTSNMLNVALISVLLAQAPAPQDVPFEIVGGNCRLEVTPVGSAQTIRGATSGGLSQNSANQAAQTAQRRYRIRGTIDGQTVDEYATGRTRTDVAGITSLTTVTQFESSSGLRFQVRNPVPGKTVAQQILNAPVFTPDLSSIQAWAMNRYRERRAKEQSMKDYYGFRSDFEMKSFLGQYASRIRAAEKRGSPDPIGEVLEEQRAQGRYPRAKK